MRRTLLAVLTALLLPILACHEEGPVTVLFTGDERGYLVPAG